MVSTVPKHNAASSAAPRSDLWIGRFIDEKSNPQAERGVPTGCDWAARFMVLGSSSGKFMKEYSYVQFQRAMMRDRRKRSHPPFEACRPASVLPDALLFAPLRGPTIRWNIASAGVASWAMAGAPPPPEHGSFTARHAPPGLIRSGKRRIQWCWTWSSNWPSPHQICSPGRRLRKTLGAELPRLVLRHFL